MTLDAPRTLSPPTLACVFPCEVVASLFARRLKVSTGLCLAPLQVGPRALSGRPSLEVGWSQGGAHVPLRGGCFSLALGRTQAYLPPEALFSVPGGGEAGPGSLKESAPSPSAWGPGIQEGTWPWMGPAQRLPVCWGSRQVGGGTVGA